MATIDEQKKYTPINATSAPGINWENYQAELAKQMQYNAANPESTQAFTQSEKQEKFGSITDPIWNTGVYTKDKEGAMAAGAQWGVQVTPTEYGGESGYYYVPDVKDQRTVQEGTSGADEGLMNNQDYAIVQKQKEDWAKYNDLYNQYKDIDAEKAAEYLNARDQAHLNAERIRAGYGYSGGQDGSMYITHGKLGADANGNGQSSGGGSSGSGSPGSSNGGNFSGSSGGSQVGTPDLKPLLDAWKAQAEEQSGLQVDFAVQQAITDLERALADAQPQFKEQQEAVYRDEMNSRDNAALYAEARGDKGGIGEEQYSSIMNTAAQNRLAVQQAQTKLSTETQRQIADLRAQGEFEKADNLLEISQQYLSQLIGMEQWAAEYGLSVAQFQESIRQWQAQFEESIRQFDASLAQDQYQFDANLQYNYTNQQNSQLASLGEAMLGMGIMPDASQLAAMGMTSTQAQTYIDLVKAQQAQEQSNKSSNKTGSDKAEDSAVTYQDLYSAGCRTQADAYAYLLSKGMTSTEAKQMAQYFEEKVDDGEFEPVSSSTTSTGKDGVMTDNTVAWALKVLEAQNGDMNKLEAALIARGFDEAERLRVYRALGLIQ